MSEIRLRKDGHVWGKENNIITYTGRSVNVLNPDPDDIVAADFCHALAFINRFCGHTRDPYSVGRHTYNMVTLMAENFESIELRRQAFLHDVPEAYMSDMPSPLKIAMPAFKEHDDFFLSIILRKHGLPETLDPKVKEYDRMLVRNEMYYLLPTDSIPVPDTLLPQRYFTSAANGMQDPYNVVRALRLMYVGLFPFHSLSR